MNNMQRGILTVDIDDTVYDFLGPLIIWIRNNRPHLFASKEAQIGRLLTRDDYAYLSLAKSVGCTSEEERETVNSFYQSEDFRGLKPFSHALSVIPKLYKAGWTIYGLTSRPDIIEGLTLDALRRDFKGIFADMFFANGQVSSNGQTSKGYLAKYCRATHHVDDAPHHLEDCLAHGVKPIALHTAPWTSIVKGRGEMLHATTWEGVYFHLMDGANAVKTVDRYTAQTKP